MKPTAQILLYTMRQKKNGKYPVKLRVVYQRDHRDFKLGIDLTEDEFVEATKTKPFKQYRIVANDLIGWSNKANKIIAQLTQFTFDKFEAEFHGHHKDASDIFPFFQEYIQKLEEEDRIKTASAYQTAMNAIKLFYGKPKLSLHDINSMFLNKFQKWMLAKGNSVTTVGIYARTLRTIYNYCIGLGTIKRDENYPFVRSKFIIPAGRNIKKALPLAEIKKIYNYKTQFGSFEDRAKDFWMLSYFCNGINFKDIAMLKRKNIDGDMIRFLREKTKRSSQGNQVTISCYLTDKVKAIIDKWGGQDKSSDAFIFPILTSNDTPKEQVKKVAQFIQTTNKGMKKICNALGLGVEVTTYFSRHSAATILKQSGASISQIQEALGHSSSAVTQKYLDSFEDDTKKELSKALNNF